MEGSVDLKTFHLFLIESMNTRVLCPFEIAIGTYFVIQRMKLLRQYIAGKESIKKSPIRSDRSIYF